MKQDIRKQILDAAEVRFGQFGFQKTTMAEIAGECRMSAGNLYRYFKNKEEIGVAIATGYFDDLERQVAEAAQREGLTAAQRLEAVVLTQLRYTHARFANQPCILDLVNYITEERWDDIIAPHKVDRCRTMAGILRDGDASGEFQVDDPETIAEHYCTAIKIFDMPQFVNCFSLEELEKSARGVVALLNRGLERR